MPAAVALLVLVAILPAIPGDKAKAILKMLTISISRLTT
jgi:hypothetical protein